MTPALPPDPPTIREIAELTARLRRLSAAGRDADPADLAAFLADKDALIERFTTVNQARTVTAASRPDAPPADPARVIRGLCRDLSAARMRYANLLAAARATLSAASDGEPDALEFLADELAAQHGQHDLDPGWWDEVGR